MDMASASSLRAELSQQILTTGLPSSYDRAAIDHESIFTMDVAGRRDC
jgi:hypothetical protein